MGDEMTLGDIFAPPPLPQSKVLRLDVGEPYMDLQ